MRKICIISLAVLAFALFATRARAADHADGPAASQDPSADITDVFTWMSADASKVYLVMDLVRNATAASKFSDKVQYVFHTTSHASFGGAASPEVDVICTFDAGQMIQCWAGKDAYVTGDASNTSGIQSSDGKLRVFAGLRDDPFFFNLRGFQAVGGAVAAAVAAGPLPADPSSCPLLDSSTAGALVTQLAHAPDGSAPLDDFAHFNVLAIVVAVDKSILVSNQHPILSVWGSTNKQ